MPLGWPTNITSNGTFNIFIKEVSVALLIFDEMF